MKCFQTNGVAKCNRASTLAMVLVGLATMVACQGFSSKSASVQPPPGIGTLGANPASLNFGTVQTGTNLPLSQTVTNVGNSSVTVSQVGISGTGFTLSGITPPVTLTAGQSASFTGDLRSDINYRCER